MVALLMSYPRSGNHMVRALLEAASGQPTLGCRGNRRDTPIRDRFADDRTAPFERRSEQPIAQKMHWISEELALRRDGQVAERLCLVVRDPERCVVSQLIRRLESFGKVKRWGALLWLRKPRNLERTVLSEVAQWYILIDHYLASDLPKLVVGFEDLLSVDGLAIVNDGLLPFFGVQERFDDVERMRAVADYGRESQLEDVKTLPEGVADYAHLRSDIVDVVRSSVDYNEIRTRLSLPQTSSLVRVGSA